MPELTTREKLVDTIMDLAGDAFETIASVTELARESEAELVDRLIHIAEYWRNDAAEYWRNEVNKLED